MALVLPPLLQQYLAVGLADLLITVIGILDLSLQGSCSVIEPVHIHKTIAFSHLARSCGNHINGTPVQIAHNLYAVQNGLMNIFQMIFHIFHTEGIVDLAVLVQILVKAYSVLHDEQRQMIPVIIYIQHIADSLGINRPAPGFRGASGQIGILLAQKSACVSAEGVVFVISG